MEPGGIEQISTLAAHSSQRPIGCRFDINRHDTIGPDNLQRLLCVGFVSLCPVRQSDRDELSLMTVRRRLSTRTEQASRQSVNTPLIPST